MNQASQPMRRTLEGRIISDKMQKTVTVLIERRVKHPVIGKVITRSKKYHAHIEDLSAVNGDLVQIEECAPIAKTKAWRVCKVIEKARVV
ncbi:MAG: 30S ribosomal protein S17 [Pseudomonadota bacterium]|jgi:small subunit ribosomal protein S17